MRTKKKMLHRILSGCALLSPLLLFPAVAATLEGCALQEAIMQQKPLPPEVSIHEAARMRENGAFMLDVREVSEWDEFHIPGSILIPLGQLPQRVDEIPRNRDVVIVCRTGNRSRMGRDILLRSGFGRVTSMQGGVTQWKSQGYQTVSGP